MQNNKSIYRHIWVGMASVAVGKAGGCGKQVKKQGHWGYLLQKIEIPHWCGDSNAAPSIGSKSGHAEYMYACSHIQICNNSTQIYKLATYTHM